MRYSPMHQIAKYVGDAPNVYLVIILLILNHFWCLEHRGAELRNHRECVILRLLANVEVYQF